MASSLSGVRRGREPKGSTFLRSEEMNYGRAVLNSNWYIHAITDLGIN